MLEEQGGGQGPLSPPSTSLISLDSLRNVSGHSRAGLTQQEEVAGGEEGAQQEGIWRAPGVRAVLPSCLSIHGPKAVSGPQKGLLTLDCKYDQGWEFNKKWWCRGADWGSCRILIKTKESEQEVKVGRMSIRDNQKSRTFTVTMVDLREEDADTYWCGIERTGPDLGFQVKVTIDPATSEKTTGSPAMTGPSARGSLGRMTLSTLLPLIFAVLLLLLVAASFLAWRILKRQKKAAGTPSEQVLQVLEGDSCYANLTLQQSGTSRASSRKKASTKSPSVRADQAEVDYVTMASLPEEEVSYAALCLDTSYQEPTYGNTGPFPAQGPTHHHKESTEYSTIRKH
ncbi:CMRF35-like molecule 1 isoform X2 [Dasypus novemcinctus]|uniref:CMRF35-like molecule 1 isoform X2 n=1 Tax=Dasypus novemcinctus TaxID=9361 RepID=UPI00265D84E8|nr:CMRF35-like molecule 1 isoform X2 [Dasypus novemcinctus]